MLVWATCPPTSAADLWQDEDSNATFSATMIRAAVAQLEEHTLTVHPPFTKTVHLSELAPGQVATICRVRGPITARRRMLEMGLVRGETITVERYAPLGDPVQYKIKGYYLSLRRRDAAHVDVEIVSQP